MKVGDYCSRDVVVVRAGESVLDAVSVMREYHVGDVVIVSEQEDKTVPLGIVTDRDIVMEVVAKQLNPTDIVVGDLVTRELVIARASDDLDGCIKQMKKNRVRRIPVIDDSESLVGILSFDDIVEYLSEQLNELVRLIRFQPEKEEEKLG